MIDYKIRPAIIAFTGGMGNGKTTCTNILMDFIPEAFIIKFAQPIYDMQNSIYKLADIKLEQKDRKLMQFLGTDWGRSIDENLWVNLYEKKVRATRNNFFDYCPTIITDDLRFDNEAEKIKELGGLILKVVGNSKDTYLNEHKSEQGINEKYIDFIVDNRGSFEDLKNQLKFFVDFHFEIPYSDYQR